MPHAGQSINTRHRTASVLAAMRRARLRFGSCSGSGWRRIDAARRKRYGMVSGESGASAGVAAVLPNVRRLARLAPAIGLYAVVPPGISRGQAPAAPVPATDSTAPALSEAEIADAIAWGTREKKPYAYRGGASGGGLGGMLARASELVPMLVVMGPYGRVATEAAAAARRYQGFDRARVSASALEPVVYVYVEPPAPARNEPTRDAQVRQIEHVVLIPIKPKGAPAVQPLRTESAPMRWQNAFGATFAGTGMTAVFARSAIPQETFEVVVIASGKEARVPVAAKQQQWLR